MKLRQNLTLFFSIRLFFGLMLCLWLMPQVLHAQQKWRSARPEQQEQKIKYYQALRLEQQGRIEQAKQIYAYLTQQDPGNIIYYKRYVRLLLATESYAEMEEVITRFLEKHPQNIEAIVDRGKLYFARGDTSQAHDYWQQALEKFGHSTTFYRHLFYALLENRALDRAEALVWEAREYHQRKDLLSLELANYYMSTRRYEAAAGEYLQYADQDERKYNTVTRQLLQIPHEEKVFQSIDSLLQAKLEQHPDFVPLYQLRSELLFRFQEYEKATDMAFKSEQISGYPGKVVLTLAKDLLREKEYGQAEYIYHQVITEEQFAKVVPEALLGLAKTLEEKLLAQQQTEPLHYFYPDNIFFNTDFVNQLADQYDLKRAFAIYDSLITIHPQTHYSARAIYRLGDLRFRLTHDFDGALQFLQRALKASREAALTQQCITRIVDVYIARGDLDQAQDIIEKYLSEYEGSQFEKNLAVKQVLSLYLAGEIDSVISQKNHILGLLTAEHDLYNDFFGLTNFLDQYYTGTSTASQEAFNYFSKGERFLHQNKLSQAASSYGFIIENYPAAPVIAPARFRLAQIQLVMHQFESARKTLIPVLNGDNQWADQAAFMLAEINHFKRQDLTRAVQWYERILMDFQQSFYAEVARKRLRTLQAE